MQAIILAAGKGTRLAPITDEIPKPLIPVCGEPIIMRLLQSLPEQIDEIIIVIGHKGEMIQQALGEVYAGKKIVYVTQGEMHGTYGALLSAKPHITTEHFLVLGADDIQDTEALTTMITKPLAFGVHHKILPQKEYLIVDIHDTIVRGMRRPTEIEFEKPQPMATGIYLLDSRVWNYPPAEYKDGEFGIPQTIRPMLLECDFTAIEMPHWIQINSHEDLAYAERELTKIALPLQ